MEKTKGTDVFWSKLCITNLFCFICSHPFSLSWGRNRNWCRIKNLFHVKCKLSTKKVWYASGAKMAWCKNKFLQGNCFVFIVFYKIKNTKVKKIALHFCNAPNEWKKAWCWTFCCVFDFSVFFVFDFGVFYFIKNKKKHQNQKHQTKNASREKVLPF